jgi:hypothetical protein
VVDGAYIKKKEITDTTARVTVEIPGTRVWKVISEELTVDQRQ